MQSDYIMRIVEQFVKVLLSIMTARKAGNQEEAQKQIQMASRFYLKTDIDLLTLYSHEQLIGYFTDFEGRLDTERCVFCADLFYELALLHEARQETNDALRLKMVCLHLYSIAIPQDKQFQTPAYFEITRVLAESLKGQKLPETNLKPDLPAES